jgi:hypothetical protein
MTTDVPSPLGLLVRQARLADPGAEEVVIFTYNHDLAFFERAALALVQQTGARVTVVADARVARHDLYAVRRAGLAYLPGLAWCAGAFHPKMLIVAGPGRATVAVGSGNLTLAGWQGNDELWTVHHADADHRPTVVAAVAAWLRALPRVVTLSDGAEEALRRTARLLDPLAGGDGDAVFVHSLDTPILDQLPHGPVDQLNLYAPFHDPGAAAVAALIDRLQPARVTVAVQPTLTHVDGPATRACLRADDQVVTIADSPYRHGKLVEWTADGRRWALTGSPNLSKAALLLTATTGGNVEIGVIAPTEATLLPEGVPTTPAALAAIEYPHADDEPLPAVVVLAAVRKNGGLYVQLARPLPQPATVEASPLGASPDEWADLCNMSAGDPDGLLPEDLVGGSRVRVRLADGSRSREAFVVDPVRVLEPHGGGGGHRGRPAPGLDEVLSDPRAAEQLVRVAGELRQSYLNAAAPAGGGAGHGATPAFQVGDWEDYLARCQGRVGPVTLAFALGIPVRHAAGRPVADIDWDDETVPEDDFGGLDDDTAEQDEADAAESRGLPAYRIADHARARYRKVAENLTHPAPGASPVEVLLALRLTLLLVAGGAWPPDDKTWAGLVLDGVAGLGTTGTGDQYEEAAGSLAALALCVVQSSLSPADRTLTTVRFGRVSDEVGHLLVAATPDRVEAYAEGLERAFVAHSHPLVVLDLRDRLVNANPVADAVAELAERGITATAEGPVIVLAKPVPDPLLPAMAALAAADGAPLVAVHSPGTKGWATVVWQPPDLIVVRPGVKPGTVSCRHYRYPRGSSPAADIRTGERPDRPATQTLAGQPLPEGAVRLLNAVGMPTGRPQPAS